jgi:hypothetical protein
MTFSLAEKRVDVAGHGGMVGDAIVRHAISLLVHEQVPVIVDQCRNLECFARQAIVMIHVSPSATFRREDLATALADGGCTRSIVNPVSVNTEWGQIIDAHFANIDALAHYCDDDTTISFHASNDLLLVELPPMGVPGLALYEQREVSANAVWRLPRIWFREGNAVNRLLDALDCKVAVGGQIEGSSYPYAMLSALIARFRVDPAIGAQLPRIAEELVFTAYAASHLHAPTGQPYVRFRKPLLPLAASFFVPRVLRNTVAGRAVIQGCHLISAKIDADDASIAEADRIIAGEKLDQYPWALGMPPASHALFHGIKRVARHMDDPLRLHIRNHTQAVLRRREETGK